MNRVIISFLGFAFAVLLLEAGLRATAALDLRSRNQSSLPNETRAHLLARPFRILVLGNSYTYGIGADPGYSYPEQLQRMLEAERPGRVAVFNEGRGNTNTRHILDELSRNLDFYKPQVVVLMTGQPNMWNPYGYADYLAEARQPGPPSWLYRLHDLLYPIRVFRLAFVLSGAFAMEREKATGTSRMSLAFPEVPLGNTDELSLRWIASSSTPHWLRSINKEQAEEGFQVLLQYQKAHPEAARVYINLARLISICFHRIPEAIGWLRRGLAVNPGKFQPSAYMVLDGIGKDPTSQGIPEMKLASIEVAKGQPSGVQRKRLLDWFMNVRLPYDEKQEGNREKNIAFLEWVAKVSPANPNTYLTLAKQYHQKKDYPASLRAMEKGILANPEQTRITFLGLMKEDVRVSGSEALAHEFDEFRAEYRRQYPSLAWAMEVVEPQDELPWVRFDIQKIYRRVHAEGLPLVLQTYPPRRHGEGEWLANIAIRELGTQPGVFVSDSDRRLREHFRAHGNKDSYYSFFQGSDDEHLNNRGYGLIAEHLHDTLRDNQLIP